MGTTRSFVAFVILTCLLFSGSCEEELKAPAAPGNLVAVAAGTSAISLSWTDNSGNETGFYIHRSTGNSQNFSQIKSVARNQSSYTDNGLDENTSYYYQVYAFNDAGRSEASNTSNCKTQMGVPAAPANLSAVALSSSKIKLTWTDQSSNEDGFRIERSTGSSSSFSEIATVGPNINSLENTALSPSTTYVYRIRAYNSAGNSGYSGTASATTQSSTSSIPAAPTSLTASAASSSQINLSWKDNASNETGYKVERAPGGTTNFTEIASLGANTTTCQNTGLTASTAYSYRVRAYNSSGNSAYSNTASATTQAAAVTIPAAPTSLTAAAVSSSQIDLNWKDNANNETGYKVERAPGGTTSFTEIASLGSNVTSYQSTGLNASSNYSYRVRSYNSAGNSAYSNTSSATTKPPAPTLPAAPTSLTAAAVSSSQINLSWNDNANNETGYKVERAPGGTTSFTEIASLGSNLTSYQSTGLNASSAYSYRVRAYNSAGNSAYSNTATATTQAPAVTIPAAPGNLGGSASGISQINLTWTDNANNETGYKLERAPGGTTSFAEIASLGSNVTSYSDLGLYASTTYAYRVRAYNSAGNSAYSNTASIKTWDPPPIPPTAPTGLSVTALSPASVKLSWTDNSNNESGFEIQRIHPSLGTWVSVYTTGSNIQTYTHSGLSETWPSYRVRATGSGGNSSWSNEADPPPILRVVNNLYNKVSANNNDWGKLNNIVRVRIASSSSAVTAAGNTYERLEPLESMSDISNADWIAPSYTAANTYKDFPVSNYSGIGTTYYLYLQCGWWEYFIPSVGNGYWIKRFSAVLCSNGACCCDKWAWIQIINHGAGYFVINATQVGLVNGSWNNTLKSTSPVIIDAGPVQTGEQESGDNP